MGIWKCSFWVILSMGGSNHLCFHQGPRWCQCFWSMDLTLSCKVLESLQYNSFSRLKSTSHSPAEWVIGSLCRETSGVLHSLLLWEMSPTVGTDFLVPRCYLGNFCALVLVLFLEPQDKNLKNIFIFPLILLLSGLNLLISIWTLPGISVL